MLDLSFHKNRRCSICSPLVLQAAYEISSRISLNAEKRDSETFSRKFQQFGLTSREQKIAYAWLQNQTVPEIADSYSISIHTVRTMIKNIYGKTEVGNKVDFIYKFQ